MATSIDFTDGISHEGSSHVSNDGAGPGYRIGTVAGLTGLDPHTIRAWERRHAAVRPLRTEGGTRLYDESAIERLQLLKSLVDCGEPIRKVATLSDRSSRSESVGTLRIGSPQSTRLFSSCRRSMALSS